MAPISKWTGWLARLKHSAEMRSFVQRVVTKDQAQPIQSARILDAAAIAKNDRLPGDNAATRCFICSKEIPNGGKDEHA